MIPRRSRKGRSTVATLCLVVACAACIAWLARVASDLDPIHRGGRLMRDRRASERLRGVQTIAGAASVVDDARTASAALPTLLEAARDDSPAVRLEAIRSLRILLASIHTPPPKTPASPTRQADLKSAVGILVGALRDDEPEIRSAGAGVLAALVPDSIGAAPALIAALDDPAAAVRRSAVLALTQMSGSSPLPIDKILVKHKDADASVRLVILKSMVKPGTAGGAGAQCLLAALEDDDRAVRLEAVRMLSHWPTGSVRLVPELANMALPPLLEGVTDDDLSMRQAAAWCLAGMVRPGQTRLLPALEAALATSKDDSVRGGLTEAISRIAGKSAPSTKPIESPISADDEKR